MQMNSVEMMHRPDRSLFNVLIAPQTYKNVAYLLVGFPLALTYFLILVTGLATGFSLSIIGVGLFLLWLTVFMSRGFMTAQRELAVGFLGRRLKELPPAAEPTNLREQFVVPLLDPFTWKMVAYLLTNFVLSSFAFIVTVSLLTTTVALLMAPILKKLSTILKN